MTLTTRTLPAQWEQILFGGNLLAVEPREAQAALAWLQREKLGLPMASADKTRFQWSNDANHIPQGGEVLDFIFLLP